MAQQRTALDLKIPNTPWWHFTAAKVWGQRAWPRGSAVECEGYMWNGALYIMDKEIKQ